MGETYLQTMRCPLYRRRDSNPGSQMELETLYCDAKGKGTSGDPARLKVPKRKTGSDCPIVVEKWGNAHGAKGTGHTRRERPRQLETGGPD